MALPIIVTPSRIELGHRCYRRHVLTDVLHRASYYSPSLEFGSVVHAGGGKWWETSNLALAHQAVELEWAKRFDQNPQVSQKDVSLPMAISMVTGYSEQAKLSGCFELEEGSWQLVTTEQRIEVPLTPDIKLSFQTDRVVYNKTTGHLVVVDIKTASRLDSKWMRQWETSLQMKLYKWATAKAYAWDPSKVDVVIEGVLKHVPTKVLPIPCPNWSEALLAEAVRQAISIGEKDKEILHADIGGSKLGGLEVLATQYTDHNYADCFAYNVECPFRQKICLAEPETRASVLKADYFETEGEY